MKNELHEPPLQPPDPHEGMTLVFLIAASVISLVLYAVLCMGLRSMS